MRASRVYRNEELRKTLVFTAAVTCWGAVSLVRTLTGHYAGFPDALGIAWPAIAPFLLNEAFARTVIDEDGIRSWRPLGRRYYRWADITEVTTEVKYARSQSAHRVRLHRATGRPRWVPFPSLPHRASAPYVDAFRREVAGIEEIRREATGREGAGRHGTRGR